MNELVRKSMYRVCNAVCWRLKGDVATEVYDSYCLSTSFMLSELEKAYGDLKKMCVIGVDWKCLELKFSMQIEYWELIIF